MFEKLLADVHGQPSTMRLVTLVVVVGVVGVWAYCSVKSGEILPLPDELVTLLLGQTGLKAAQRLWERSGSP